MYSTYTVVSQHISNESKTVHENNLSPIISFHDTYEEAFKRASYESEAIELEEMAPRQFDEQSDMFRMFSNPLQKGSLPQGKIKVTIPTRNQNVYVISTITFCKFCK